MTARVIYNIGTHRVTQIDGDEIFSCRAGSQRDKEITAADLRHYMGGDVAVPNLRLEAGANARRISDLPNAEHDLRDGDILTGLQNNQNVNFSRLQLLRSLLEAITSLELSPYMVASLPEPAMTGMQAFVIDGAHGLGWGDEVRGGGSVTYKVWFNGKAWTVTGK